MTNMCMQEIIVVSDISPMCYMSGDSPFRIVKVFPTDNFPFIFYFLCISWQENQSRGDQYYGDSIHMIRYSKSNKSHVNLYKWFLSSVSKNSIHTFVNTRDIKWWYYQHIMMNYYSSVYFEFPMYVYNYQLYIIL